MKKCPIVISVQARKDIQDFYYSICCLYKQPLTAYRNRKGLYQAIQKLSYLASAIGKNEYVQGMFGVNARHIVFKKMTIVFFVEDDVVYIQRVISSSLIY